MAKTIAELEQELVALRKLVHEHLGTKYGASSINTPHSSIPYLGTDGFIQDKYIPPMGFYL